MDWTSIETIILAGTALGTAVSGLLAYNQKVGKEVLREANKDYKERNAQLEKDNDHYKSVIKELERRITLLEEEKRLPLDELTNMIIKQHSDQSANNEKLMKQIAKVVTETAKIARYFAEESKNANQSHIE